MKICELVTLINGTVVTQQTDQNKEVAGMYSCDMLSWAMAKVGKDIAWVTIVNNRNIVAVSVLVEAACVIVAEDVEVESAVMSKADDEGITIIKTSLSSYEVCAAYSRRVDSAQLSNEGK